MTLADRIAVLLEERGPLSACRIATELRRRKADVLDALHADARFHNCGRGRSSRWSLVPFLTAEAAAARWDCDAEMARTIIFGKGGFVERGFVERLDGNGRVVVTERGLKAAAAVEAWV